MSDRYYLRDKDTETWREVTQAEFVAAERAEGFVNGYGDDRPATYGFSGEHYDGNVR